MYLTKDEIQRVLDWFDVFLIECDASADDWELKTKLETALTKENP